MKPLSRIRSNLPALTRDRVLPDEVVDLSSEYSQFTVPRPVGEAVEHAARTTDLGRDTAAGGRHLLHRIVAKLERENALEVTREQLVLTSGGTAGLCYAFGALADPGDSILVPDPGWSGYTRLAASWGIEPVPYPLTARGVPDLAQLAELAGHDTKAVVVNNPHNPTGAVLTEAEARALVDLANELDLYLISDETCDLIRFVPPPAIGPAQFDAEGRVITCFSFAKTHALAGLRLGYVVATPPLAEAVQAAQDAQLQGPSTLALAAGLAALEMDEVVVESMQEFYLQQREGALAMLPAEVLPFVPEGGYFLLVDVSASRFPDGEDFAVACLRDHQVLVAAGSRFGQRACHCIRLTMAVKEKDFSRGLEAVLSLLGAPL